MAGTNEESEFNTEDFILDPNVKRHIQLDMLRIIAILYIVVFHGNPASEQYGIHNVMMTQNWTIQLLWVTCGIHWSLTKVTLGPYVLRLSCYLVVGVSCNWIAWVFKHMDWRHDFAGVVYQMFFIVGLIFYVSFTACVKPSLMQIYLSRLGTADAGHDDAEESEHPSNGIARDASHEDSTLSVARSLKSARRGEQLGELNAEERRAVRVFGCIIVLLLLALVVVSFVLTRVKTSIIAGLVDLLGNSSEMRTDGLEDRACFGQFLGTGGAFLLVAVGAKLLRSPRLAPWLSWVVIAYVYTCRILLLPLLFEQYGGGIARLFGGFELFLVGLVANTAGFRHAGTLKIFVGDYFVWLTMAEGTIWGPTWFMRMDEHPPRDIFTIARVQVCELLFVVAFLAAGSRMFHEEGWPPRVLSWLAQTTTVLFLVHKAVHISAREPYNWLILFVVVPAAFWFITRPSPDRRTSV